MARKRKAIVGKLRAALERRGSPRLEMAVITLLTGASGFLASFALLQVGLDLMWLRYWVALFAAYLVFFGLLRLWLRLRGRKFGVRDLPDPSDLIVDLPLPGPAPYAISKRIAAARRRDLGATGRDRSCALFLRDPNPRTEDFKEPR